jgi:hypothetical protein
MQFKKLILKDKVRFKKYLSFDKHLLSAYAFENIFIWTALYEIFWIVIKSNLCIFFKDRVGCFLYLPALGQNFNIDTVNKCFEIMDSFNKNTVISRIENVEKEEAKHYKDLGYKIVLAGYDYLCRKKELSRLKGTPFKKKRTVINYFMNNYNFEYKPYQSADKKECLDLYLSWMKERKTKNSDVIYQRLLEDNFCIFKKALDSYTGLNFIARVLRIDDKIRGVTFGYPLNKDTFVVLFEVCDLKFKGISQYIFREFTRELNYKYINIMDDSGLDNLKKVKLSYRPYQIINNFVISRG